MEMPSYLHAMPEMANNIHQPEYFTYPFHYSPHPLCIMAANEVKKYLHSKAEWKEDISDGKMFGVIITSDTYGNLYFMSAFSGIFAGKNTHSYFVPPIYNLQKPDGIFKNEEAEISHINESINELENCEEIKLKESNLQKMISQSTKDISEMKQRIKEAKIARDMKRQKGLDNEDEELLLIKESQYMKAELKRKEKFWKSTIAKEKEYLDNIYTKIEVLKEERKIRSAKLQLWLFRQFIMWNGKGEKKDLIDIFNDYEGKIPPAGSGECCAPKLLQATYKLGLHPICMAEFWLGKSPKEEIRHNEEFYPACRNKCLPILKYMLQGLKVEENPLKKKMDAVVSLLKVIYEDEWLAVISKPSGMLSVPGKEDAPSVYDLLEKKWSPENHPLIVHRLDMDTSGIMIVAKTKTAHELLQEQFAKHSIKKRYLALLDGIILTDNGFIDLPICANHLDRPRQMVNFEYGKKARTYYEVIERNKDTTLVAFYPETGRTHQLRIHAAHTEGLGCPIIGDNLYGKRKAERLYLHAQSIEFIHPITKENMKFEEDIKWTLPVKI